LGLRLGIGFIFYVYFVFTKPTALLSCVTYCYGITLIGGLAGQVGWRAVFPNEECELLAGCTEDRRVGRRTARQKGGSTGCEKGRGVLQKRAALRPALFC